MFFYFCIFWRAFQAHFPGGKEEAGPTQLCDEQGGGMLGAWVEVRTNGGASGAVGPFLGPPLPRLDALARGVLPVDLVRSLPRTPPDPSSTSLLNAEIG